MARKILKTARRMLGTHKLFTFVSLLALVALLQQSVRHSAAVTLILVGTTAVALLPFIMRLWRTFRAGTYGVNVLALVVMGMAFWLQDYRTMLAVLLVALSAEPLQDVARYISRRQLRGLLAPAPARARRQQKNKLLDVPVQSLAAHDSVLIQAGETVPADAVITEGTGRFDTFNLTGERRPHEAVMGASIAGGWINRGNDITAQLVRSAHDSQYQQVRRLVQAAGETRAPLARLADWYAVLFMIVALAAAGVAWILSHEPIRFVSVLAAATIYPLAIAPGLATTAGLSRAARRGIIFKNSTAFEQLAHIKTFALSTTGVLTHASPRVTGIVSFGTNKKSDVLAAAAGVAQGSAHSLALALVREAEAKELHLAKSKHTVELPGRGLEGHIKGVDVLVGRASLLAERDIALPSQFQPKSVTETAVFVALNGRLGGYITFNDALRSEAKQALAKIKRLGVKHTVLISGGTHVVIQKLAKQLGVARVITDTLPGDKLRAVETEADRPVAFATDDSREASALMAADIGIAFNARGNTAIGEPADVIILHDDLHQLAEAVAGPRRTLLIATESIIFGTVLSLALMAILAISTLPAIIGVGLQVVVNVLVTINSLRASR